MKTKPKPHTQYQTTPQPFDAYNKETPIQEALGSSRTMKTFEVAEIHSTNWVPGVSGWRLTPTGIEFGAVPSGLFPPGSITLADIQNISTDKILGRDTAGSGVIEQLGLGAGLSISGGNLVNTVTAYTTEEAQDAVGAMVDASLTYTDSTPLLGITAAYKRKSLFDHFADVGNVGTGEDDLYSDTIAAAQLANNGEKLVAHYGGVFVGAALSTQELRIYFGGTLIYDSGALSIGVATNNWTVNLVIIRESSTVVRCNVALSTDFGTLFPYSKYTRITGLTLTNTNILKITGEAAGAGAANNQIVVSESYVEWLAAA